jgi:hypothetical protein
VDRFNRTMLDEWAYARRYNSESERAAATQVAEHLHRRGHTASPHLPIHNPP